MVRDALSGKSVSFQSLRTKALKQKVNVPSRTVMNPCSTLIVRILSSHYFCLRCHLQIVINNNESVAHFPVTDGFIYLQRRNVFIGVGKLLMAHHLYAWVYLYLVLDAPHRIHNKRNADEFQFCMQIPRDYFKLHLIEFF